MIVIITGIYIGKTTRNKGGLMMTIKTILMLIVLATLVVSIDTSCKLAGLDQRITEIRETWTLATTPAQPIEEISVDELTNPIPAWVDPKKETR